MASNPSPTTSGGSTISRSNSTNDALSLDIQVLTLLLQRNHHQQHRCIYYRRLSMVLLALRRASSSLDWLLIDDFERLSGQVYRQQHQQANKDAADNVSSRKRRLKKEEHWTIQRDEEHDTIKIINNDDTTNNSNVSSSNAETEIMHTTQLINTLQTIRHLTTKSIPQLSSRIIHATSPILHELSRGYFVPFLTVALACLGRIHVLLLRLGRELVGTLSQHVPKLRDCVADGGRKKEKSGGLIQLKEALAPFIVNSMHTSLNEGREQPSNNEWNELMKPFTEISHDEFTKNMRNFVRDCRWKDAITAFGIKKDDDLNNELQLGLSRQLSDVAHDGNEDEDGTGESMNMDDLGELIYMQQQEHDDKKDDTRRSNVDVDENMARVLDHKRQIDETSSSSTAAKKKKRRRKTKKSAGDLEVMKDAADNANDKGTKKESKQSDDIIKKTAEEDAKVASKQCDKGLDSSQDVQLQKSRLSTKESSNSSDEAIADAAQQSQVDVVAKKEKKSKKKKTKKKKSKNVIDDIFG